jgi:hypothetical protein
LSHKHPLAGQAIRPVCLLCAGLRLLIIHVHIAPACVTKGAQRSQQGIDRHGLGRVDAPDFNEGAGEAAVAAKIKVVDAAAVPASFACPSI